MKKIIIGILLLFIVIGTVYAVHNNEKFKAPTGLHAMGYNDFVDEKGHNIGIMEYTDDYYNTWFKNDTEDGYLVQPYSENPKYYIYADDENDCGILEIVEKDGAKYIINSWTPNGSDEAKVILDNLLEFNKLNNIKPLPVEG